MESLTIVKHTIPRYTQFQFCERVVVFDGDVFILQRPPKSFHNDGIKRSVHTIYANLYSMRLQNREKRIRGKPTVKVGVAHSKFRIFCLSFFSCIRFRIVHRNEGTEQASRLFRLNCRASEILSEMLSESLKNGQHERLQLLQCEKLGLLSVMRAVPLWLERNLFREALRFQLSKSLLV